MHNHRYYIFTIRNDYTTESKNQCFKEIKLIHKFQNPLITYDSDYFTAYTENNKFDIKNLELIAISYTKNEYTYFITIYCDGVKKIMDADFVIYRDDEIIVD